MRCTAASVRSLLRSSRSYPHSRPLGMAQSSTTNDNALSSARGRHAVDLLPTYLADARSVPKYHAMDAPQGALQLGVAESLILEDLLVPALNNNNDTIPADAIYYQPTAGRPGLRESVAAYAEHLLELPQNSLNIDNFIVGAGCNAVLENLCFCLAAPGDAVLIPTPYYAAFEFDLVARANLYVQAVEYNDDKHADGTSGATSIDPSVYYPTRASLDAAYEQAAQSGHPPRILLLSHPNNPLGVCYPSHVVKECIDWCNERKVHLVSDEIYAGSIYRPEAAQFESVLQLADSTGDGGLGPYIHWVYALSKDFALSGLRVGAVYTENPEILVPLQKLNDLCQISSTTQLWTESTLSNSEWVDTFRTENHRRLEARCTALTSVLDECGIPYLQPDSGLFLWLDLSQFLNSTTMTTERDLYRTLVHNVGLLLTPGESMRHGRPGFFRCVFTAATDQEFAVALERFRTLPEMLVSPSQ